MRFFSCLYVLAIGVLAFLASECVGQFTNVYNVPGSSPPQQVGSSTQINIASSSYGFSPDAWVLGAEDQSSSDIEVNLGAAGVIEGDVVANSGVRLNIKHLQASIHGDLELTGSSVLTVNTLAYFYWPAEGFVTGLITVRDGALVDLVVSPYGSPTDVRIADGGTLRVSSSSGIGDVALEPGGVIDFAGNFRAKSLTLMEDTFLAIPAGRSFESNIDILSGANLEVHGGSSSNPLNSVTVRSGANLTSYAGSRLPKVDVLAGGEAWIGADSGLVHAYTGSTVHVTGSGFSSSTLQVDVGSNVTLNNARSNVTLADDASLSATGGRTILIAGKDSQSTFSGGTLAAKLSQGATATAVGVKTQFALDSGSTIRVEGGLLHNKNWAPAGSTAVLVGAEFTIDGVPVSGLSNLGDRVDLTIAPGQIIQGVMAGGVPFQLSPQRGDQIEAISFELAEVPAVTDGQVITPTGSQPVPQGLRKGQTLVLNSGKSLPSDFRAESGSTVTIQPNTGVGYSLSSYTLNGEKASLGGFESYGATFNVSGYTTPASFYDESVVNLKSGGEFIQRAAFFEGSTLNVQGGKTPGTNYDAPIYTPNGAYFNGSTLNLTSGEVRYARLSDGSVANISGGTATELELFDSQLAISKGTVTTLKAADSEVAMSGGIVKRLDAMGSGTIGMAGGAILSLNPSPTTTFQISGESFLLDGLPLAGLDNDGDSVELSLDLTNSVLTGVLRDGSPFVIGNGLRGTVGSTTAALTRATAPPVTVTSPNPTSVTGLRSGQSVNTTMTLPAGFLASPGSSVRLTSGAAEDLVAVGASLDFVGAIADRLRAVQGTSVNVAPGTRAGGSLIRGAIIEDTTTLLVEKGNRVEDLTVGPGGIAALRSHYRGGLTVEDGGQVMFFGDRFYINDTPVEFDINGTATIPAVGVNDRLVGLAEDGTMVLVENVGQTVAAETISLHKTVIDSTPFNRTVRNNDTWYQSEPLRAGGTITVRETDSSAYFRAVPFGAVIDIRGISTKTGSVVAENAYGATINVFTYGRLTRASAYFDTVINVVGGESTSVTLHNGAKMHVESGTANDPVAMPGSLITVSSGNVYRPVIDGGRLEFNGDRLNQLEVKNGGVAVMTRGSFSNSNPHVVDDSAFHLAGGTVRHLNATKGFISVASGAAQGLLDTADESVFVQSGGAVSQLALRTASQAHLSGGSLDTLTVDASSELHLYGSEFLIDGAPIAGLSPGDRFVIDPSSASMLAGVFSSGNAFAFNLAGSTTGNDSIASDSLLTVTLVGDPGDYNYDGVVNAADYTVWRDAFELGDSYANYHHADGDFNGVVDDRDRGVWAAHYGADSTAEPASQVPEPVSVGLLAMAGLLGSASASRRRKRV